MDATSPQVVYTPDAVIDIVTESLKPALPATPFLMKGLYRQTSATLYGGYYYGRLHSTSGGYEITVRVPEKIKPAPTNGEHYVFSGYLTKRPKRKGHVDLVFSVTTVEGREPQEFSRIISIYQQKAIQGYRDVEARIKRKIISGERVRIARIYGHASIVDKDVDAAFNQIASYMEIVEQCYDFTDCRVSMGSPADIEKELQKLAQEDYDLIAILRGGGSNLSVFDDLTLAETAAALKIPLIVGIGHEVDKPFVQVIADKSCATPTAFGYFLRDTASAALAERKQIESDKVQQLDNLAEAKEKVHQLEQGKHELEKLLEQERTQANQIQQKLAGLADELDRANHQLRTQLAQNEEQLTAHVAKSHELNRGIETKSVQIVEQAERIDQLENTLTVNRQEVSQHLLHIAELEQEIQRLQQKQKQVQQGLADENALLHTTIRGLNEQMAEFQATIRGLHEQVAKKSVRFNRFVLAGATLLVVITVIYFLQVDLGSLLSTR
jgi:hypothetical protein